MLRLSVLTSLLMVVGGLYAAPEWENEAIFQVNREPARASLLPTDPASQFALNGVWNFHFSVE